MHFKECEVVARAVNDYEWGYFLAGWSGIARAYTYHEAWRKLGYKVQLAERGVVIYRPKAVSYLDQI